MKHVAIDLGRRESQVCAREPAGEIILERRIQTRALGELLERLEHSRVIVESCSAAFTMADIAKAAGHEPCVVPATLAPSLGVGERQMKNDVRDARKLSEASCRMTKLPSVHIPSEQSRERKAVCTSREVLVKQRTCAINRVRSYMAEHLLPDLKRCTVSFVSKVRELLLALPNGIPAHVERLLKAIEFLTVQIVDADKELKSIASNDPVCKRLMTVPGVGPQTAIRFSAAIDDPKRFDSAAQIYSYLGLTPGEDTTGFKTRRTGLTRAGAPRVRWVLVQAAWSMWRSRPGDPVVLWAKKIAARGKASRAIVALARKLAGILFALWRDGTQYDPNYESKRRAELERDANTKIIA